MGSLNRDSVIAIVLLAFCGLMFWETFNIPRFESAAIGSEVWPRLIIAALAALSLVYLLQSLRRPAEPAAIAGRGAFLRAYRNPIWCFVLFALFLVTLDYLGMLLGGVLYVFLMLTALGNRSPRDHLAHAAIAVGSVGVMWAIFTYGLRVYMPEGEVLRIW
ncbi:MAG: tripartite tricarboxylate transporter TctB family protein [Proteobacteria bacterium]|nr:tripartite tricarboxylate transporter TctB family protein [Pseudomonadota bacterium]